jgi:2-amino-4-hydroxy-6-hydroxymethyldihydropteridine diphosphokinase
MSAHRAYIGMGANLGNRIRNIERAVAAVGKLGTVLRTSSIYRTKPWGNLRQPWFANAAVLLETKLSPRRLLNELKAAEKNLGRTQNERWGPREIDLDLLLYDDLEIDEPDLRVPHAHLRERAFVLVPLAQIDPRFETMRDALPVAELAGVVPCDGARSVGSLGESVLRMSSEPNHSAGERVRELSRFLAESDAVRVRIERRNDEIEIVRRVRDTSSSLRLLDREPAEAAVPRIDTIKADLVGIFHVSRPTPLEGDVFDAGRELGYIEALGIRTPVHSMGSGRLVSVATADGTPVEYGQPLFLVARV